MGNQATKPRNQEGETTTATEEEFTETIIAKKPLSMSLSSNSLSSDSSGRRSPARDEEDVLENPLESSDGREPVTIISIDDLTEKKQQEEDKSSEKQCAMPAIEVLSCGIPSVLTLYRKDAPLLVRTTEHQDDDDDDDNDDVAGSAARQKDEALSDLESACAAMVPRRRRSWSAASASSTAGSAISRKLGFLSKYAPASASTSSLTALLARTTQSTKTDSYSQEERDMIDGHLPTPESCLSRQRDYFIVTTAALPWMTGTAVNPLLRAASLSRYQRQRFQTGSRSTVTLVIPWLDLASDRQLLYGDEWKEKSQAEQEAYIRDWLVTKANMPDEALPPSEGGIQIIFYPARYHEKMSSIFAMGDLCEYMVQQHNLTIGPDAVCVLEEPEHLHFFRATSFRDYFCFVVGVVHTNYKAYASTAMPLGGSFIAGPLMGTMSSLLVRAYCDKVIKLSPVLQSFDCPEKETVCNVHGIRHDFMEEGKRRARDSVSNPDKNGNKIYFVGKLLWAKGLDKLMELETLYRSMTGQYFEIDIYGSGSDADEIEQAFLSERPSFLGGNQSNGSSSALEELAAVSPCSTGAEVGVSDFTEGETDNKNTDPDENASTEKKTDNNTMLTSSRLGLATTYYSTFVRRRQPIPARFLGRKDHAQLTNDYKIFVNPSITEVLCTTTAEATAMGKFVIIPSHPSNSFFHQFPNCLLYKSKAEFVDFLQYAITHQPEPLQPEMIRVLTWEAATERFIKAAAICRRDAKWRERVGKTKSEEKIAKMHQELGHGTKGDMLRKVLGGGPVAGQFQYECQQLQRAAESVNDGDDDDVVGEVAAIPVA